MTAETGPGSEYTEGGVPKPALWLTAAGAVPFVCLAIAAFAADTVAGVDVRSALAGYGAVILSFLGGVQWGFASARVGTPEAEPVSARRLTISIVPPLIGWAALLLADPFRLMLLAVAFLAVLMTDMAQAGRGETPPWWPSLRMPVSGVVIAALVAASFA
jgi:hypothetical protein